MRVGDTGLTAEGGGVSSITGVASGGAVEAGTCGVTGWHDVCVVGTGVGVARTDEGVGRTEEGAAGVGVLTTC